MQQRLNRRRAYRRIEDLYHKSIEDVKDYAIFMIDAENHVVSWNLGAERILGYSEEEILGRSASRFFTPEDLSKGEDEKELRRAAAEGRAEDERWHLRRDGTLFWASGVVTPVRDHAGTLLGFTKVMRDMTERKWLEEERDRFFTLSMDMLCIVALEGYYKRVNPAFEKNLGYTAEEFLATPIFDFLHPEDRPALKAEYVKLSTGEPTAYLENRIKCKGGSYKWVGWTYFPVPEEGLAYGVGRDVTRHRQMEEVLKLRAEELQQANRLKDEFLATLSHELRTPLTSILGWSRLLRAGQFKNEAEQERAVEIIERNAEAQARLIEDLLDVSRIITGKLRLETQPVAPAAVIETALSALRPAAEARNIQLDSVIDSTAGPVIADPGRLQQIVTNLLSNAIKFTPEGGRVEVQLMRADSHIRITVRDTGIGISPEVLPYIFERFRQADSTNTRAHSGLGLGLAIVRHLVERHGGVVHAESEGEGQGAVFTVDLPLNMTESGPGESEQPQTMRHQTLSAADAEDVFDNPCALEGLRVLLVEDEQDTRELVKAILERCGAEVTAVASVDEALTSIERRKADVLISDIGMPGGNGYELIRKIRALEPEGGARVRAVALTAYAGPKDRRRALLAGFQVHLAKPIEPDELLAVVASLGWRGDKILP
jgi:PAS domain S-box-containing protein